MMSFQILSDHAQERTKTTDIREEGGSKGCVLSLENPMENTFYGDNCDYLESPYMSANHYPSD
jgi:hypothetical protein